MASQDDDGREGTVSFDVEAVEAETERAILVEIEGEKVWVPKSQITEDSEVYSKKSGGGELIVTRWWAEQQGLA
jgi:hypothetical protein